MHKASFNTKGFGLVGVLIIILALVVVAGTGAYVYHRDHTAKATATASTTKGSPQPRKPNPTAAADIYAGWESYCDTTYHYCFKYPSSWTFDSNVALSPSKTVQIAYTNPDTRDGGLMQFTPSFVGALPKANQAVTVVGGYYTTDGAYSPLYSIVDSELLAGSPLSVGKQGQFTANPTFTDKGSDELGQLTATPAISIGGVSDAQTWLNSADAITGLQILQSFSYN